MPLPPPITSRSNARVKRLRAAFSGKAAESGELVGIEGEHLLTEAMRSGVELDTVFLREGSEAALNSDAFAGLNARQWAVLSAEVYAAVVDTISPQGIAATLRIRTREIPDKAEQHCLCLVLENLQDPGNLGTLLRSAEAFAVRAVYLTTGSVNPWSPKAIRASAGSVFRVPIVRGLLAELGAKLQEDGVRLLACVAADGGATSLVKTDLRGPCAAMIGNEGAGLSAEALAMADDRLHIPCHVESLNAAVAGSTVMYEALRQRLLQERRLSPSSQP